MAQSAASPDPAPGEALAFASLTAGNEFVCGLTAGGLAYCWGNNGFGQLGAKGTERCPVLLTGMPDVACASSPQRVGGGHRFAQIDAGASHVCGLTAVGEAFCWGNNVAGALGTATSLPSCVGPERRLPADLLPGCTGQPVPVAGDLRFTTLSAGSTTSCALTADGEGYCWGMSGSGTARRLHPTPRPLAGERRYVAISVGGSRPCAIDRDGAAWCWDRWADGEATIVAAPEPLTQVSFSGYHACALTAAGVAYCWGDNTNAQLGAGRQPAGHERVDTPTRVVGDHRFRSIEAGGGSTCAITFADALYCWGYRVGLRGTPGTVECLNVDAYDPCTPAPMRMTDAAVRAVAGSASATCAATTDGSGLCWGRSRSGSFGDGTVAPTPAVRIDLPLPVRWTVPIP